jgi:hypothetical protein
MDIEGIRLFTVRDKAGSLIDLRFYFTVTNGHQIALYGFDKASSKSNQKTADQAIENSKQLVRMKESVKKIGVDAGKPVTQRVTAGIFDIVPNEEGPAKIIIGKVEKGHFSVRLSIEQKKPEDRIALEVPFDGDPGAMKGKVFDGQAFFLQDGQTEVAKLKLELYNVGN